MIHKQPFPVIQTTTLWDFPSQHYGDKAQGNQDYTGVTPSYLIWNLLQRYTKPGDVVVDPMCGSGTTLDVAKDLGRKGMGFDVRPTRPDIQGSDARKLPIEANSADFVFVDPPYSTHVDYSDDPRCIGKLDAREDDYYAAMEKVIAEIHRILRPGRYCALYVSDSQAKGKSFCPIGFELFMRLAQTFEPVDIVCVTRHNRKMKRNHWHTSAIEGNYYLRGFNYLFIMRKRPVEQATLHKHEEAGSLPHYFRAATRSHPGEVITPEKLSEVIAADTDHRMDRKLAKKGARERTKGKPFASPQRRPMRGKAKRRDAR